MTRQAPPEGVLPPVVTFFNSTYILLSWEPPQLPNGIIQTYIIYSTELNLRILLDGWSERILRLTGEGLNSLNIFSCYMETLSSYSMNIASLVLER